ncbi:hypothetical protein Y032_0004g2101 [Ancylostoma ceylanicum]|uniref:Uncharacterized protein n=1 Tax=Ancylostoma ceylanicum TaxID=53326 RepID=A0A016VV96_9BILA|nr:hypothetical protein Y032_0004g2101 [Ancylostoma ceylanicum]
MISSDNCAVEQQVEPPSPRPLFELGEQVSTFCKSRTCCLHPPTFCSPPGSSRRAAVRRDLPDVLQSAGSSRRAAVRRDPYNTF